MQAKFREILLVDDDPVANYLHEDLLTEMRIGDKITTKENGEEAFQYITQHWVAAEAVPKLVLLYLNMPIMNGFELLEQLSALPLAGVSVFLLTSSENPKDLEKAKQFPVDGYLIKPLEANREFVERFGR